MLEPVPSCVERDETLTIAPRVARNASAQARAIWNAPTTLTA